MTRPVNNQSAVSPLQAYIHHAAAPGQRLYAVVDAARDTELAFAARDRFCLQLHTLFEGELAPRLDHVAPHLIPLDRDSAYLDLWAEHLGRSAGILLLTDVRTDVLRAHLRQVFVVHNDDDEEFAFRFYDPRVLRIYLPTCTGADAAEFFGPIRRILVESDQQGVMLSCTAAKTGVQIRERPLHEHTAVTPVGDLGQ